jgi:hypothetical protein
LNVICQKLKSFSKVMNEMNQYKIGKILLFNNAELYTIVEYNLSLKIHIYLCRILFCARKYLVHFQICSKTENGAFLSTKYALCSFHSVLFGLKKES